MTAPDRSIVELGAQVLCAFLPAYLRAFGLLALIPGASLGALVAKVIVPLLLALLLDPVPQACSLQGQMGVVLLSELVLGCLISLPLVAALWALEIWGELLDLARGNGIATVYDPLLERSEGALGVLVRYCACGRLMLLGGAAQLIGAFLSSVHYAPLAALRVCREQALWWVERSVHAFIEGVMIFLPWGTLCVLIELVVTVTAKLVPGLSLSNETAALKSLLLASVIAIYGFSLPGSVEFSEEGGPISQCER